ncbi:hypothetical protein TNIN_79291 [Trichonephila inaurata madagascariensis]|uniref:Uncharacterized protein n=1 Tax=Trichonephila inaurata madagascariensis TaxID=2747483 RepID=A0A8X7CFK9_9ARAC|nr:hypothetical protein TNIN_79291 [Trichonephila inaurata madagascariensis]
MGQTHQFFRYISEEGISKQFSTISEYCDSTRIVSHLITCNKTVLLAVRTRSIVGANCENDFPKRDCYKFNFLNLYLKSGTNTAGNFELEGTSVICLLLPAF